MNQPTLPIEVTPHQPCGLRHLPETPCPADSAVWGTCRMCAVKVRHRWHDNGEYNYDIDDEHEPGPTQSEVIKDDPTPREMVERAVDLVYSDRQADYGHPADDYKRTAALWSALLGFTITPKQAALCMVLVKLSREMNMPKPDNMVDAHGYLLVAGRIKERELGRE